MQDMTQVAAALLAGLAFGANAFLSFVLAPMVFRVLEGPAASAFLRALFPRYYAFTAAVGAGLLLATVLAGTGWSAAAALTLLAAASLALVPRINAARDAGEAAAARFRRLHGASVVLNLGMLAASGWLVVLFSRGWSGTA
ncbi:MAG: DUF4149 domain-containing protein [Gammaproteobacteria bacterium]